jgi:hypothetical protein
LDFNLLRDKLKQQILVYFNAEERSISEFESPIPLLEISKLFRLICLALIVVASFS